MDTEQQCVQQGNDITCIQHASGQPADGTTYVARCILTRRTILPNFIQSETMES